MEKLYRDISLEFDKRREKADILLKLRTDEVYRKIPKIQTIDEDIRKIGLNVSKIIIEDPLNYKDKMEEAKDKIRKLQMEKAYFLTENNLPPDYLDIKHQCGLCQDKGILDNGQRCSCYKQILISKAYKMSNLENILEKENFRTFNIDLFTNRALEGETMSPRENMLNILSISEGFVNNFDSKNDENLLFYGTTGLGKTFMSNCIAKALLDKNKIVIYQTAFTILDIIENHRFRRDAASIKEYEYNLLFEADLLIIDDLGTEVANTFTNAEIFNIVNTRILNGKKTIISTNLTPKEITDIYTDRVFSRILDKFIPLRFFGPDLRWEK